MARYDADGGQVPRTLFEAAAFHRSVRAACAGCGRRGTTISLTRDPPTITSLPLPSDVEWRRAVSRFLS